MDILSNLQYSPGSRKQRKRVGRGEGSGHGSQSTRGMNGQRSRAGSKKRAWFEGGQMPLQRRIPKRGFFSPFKVKYQVINLSNLQKLADKGVLEDGKVDAAVLYKNGLISKAAYPYKILGNGEIKAKLQIEAHSFSASAKEKIEAASGTTNEIKI